MSKSKKVKITGEDEETGLEDVDAAAAESEKRQTVEEIKDKATVPSLDIEEKLQASGQEAKDNYDRFLRVSAEFENYKKRTVREMEDFRKYANESLLKEMLPVVDNLELAVDSANSQAKDKGSIIEGVDLTLKEIRRVFEKFGAIPIEALEKPFDPTFHQAVLQEETEDHPENIVVREFQKGYMLKNRLLRPAMVVVSKAKECGSEKKKKQNQEE
ncbi:nucleotide exchange factor GrpE [Thermodesulfobacteriota bacterium]